jgi:hypothetical protein
MCRRLGIATGKWANWETGTKRISLNEALAFCRATGATLDWIYQGKMQSGLPRDLAERIAKIDAEHRRPARRHSEISQIAEVDAAEDNELAAERNPNTRLAALETEMRSLRKLLERS